MESHHNTSKNNSNNLWIGELDQYMDENYIKESCLSYSKKNNFLNNIFLIFRYKNKKYKNN